MRRKPKVLFISKCLAPPFQDGGKLLPLHLARHLETRRVTLLTRPGVRFAEKHLIPEAVFPAPHAWLPAGFGHLSVFLRMLRFDEIPIYHFFFAPNAASSYAARLALGLKGRQPTVQTISSAPLSTKHLGSLLFGDALVTMSEATASVIRSQTTKPVHVIAPSVDLPKPLDDSERQALRSRLSLSNDDVALLFAGDFDPGHVAGFFKKALPKLANTPHWVLFIAVRDKTPRARAEREMLEQQVNQLGLSGRVRFLGVVEDFSALLGAMDLNLFPADTLATKVDLPFVLLEGMARGVPILTSNLAPLCELGEPESLGPRHAVGDVADFLGKLAPLLEDASLRQSLGTRAREQAGDVFNHSRMAQAYEAIYQTVEMIP